jgi:hypothetical protein
MTYKWEAIAQDLTEERDRLLRENDRLRKALEQIAKPALGGKQQQWLAQAALKSEKQ